jgi:hypothetical protein
VLLADCQVVLTGKRVAAVHPKMRTRSIYGNTLRNLIDESSPVHILNMNPKGTSSSSVSRERQSNFMTFSGSF